MPITASRIEAVRLVCFAVLAVTFLGTGLWVLATWTVPPVPAPVYGIVGLAIAAVLFAVNVAATRAASEAANDEGTSAVWLRAQAFGYWAGVVCLAVMGNLIGPLDLPPGAALFAGGMLGASAPFLYFIVAEACRGRAA